MPWNSFRDFPGFSNFPPFTGSNGDGGHFLLTNDQVRQHANGSDEISNRYKAGLGACPGMSEPGAPKWTGRPQAVRNVDPGMGIKLPREMVDMDRGNMAQGRGGGGLQWPGGQGGMWFPGEMGGWPGGAGGGWPGQGGGKWMCNCPICQRRMGVR